MCLLNQATFCPKGFDDVHYGPEEAFYNKTFKLADVKLVK